MMPPVHYVDCEGESEGSEVPLICPWIADGWHMKDGVTAGWAGALATLGSFSAWLVRTDTVPGMRRPYEESQR